MARHSTRASLIVAAWLLFSSVAGAAQFTPMSCRGENSESHTGLWFCPRLGGASDVVPLKTRLYATKESVTGGVALRVDFKKGSTGGFAMENSAFPPGTAGITMYAKASEELTMTIKGKNSFKITTGWKKIDIPWGDLGTNPGKPSIGWEFRMYLTSPASGDGWYIIDRLGCEGPGFDASPKIEEVAGPDDTINTKDLVGGAELLAPTVARLKAKKPFKIFGFGDSVTAGSQMNRGNWGIKGEAAKSFLYFSHLARLLNERYGYDGVGYVQKGHGGWTSGKARSIMAQDLGGATEGDLIIIEFGANDLGWAGSTVDKWLENTRAIIAEARKHTSQIIMLSPTTGGKVPKLHEEVSKKMRAFAAAEKVAWVDITRWSMYRGEKFAWAYLANGYHPDFMGHMMMAEIIETLLGAPHFDWPEYAK